MGTFNLSKRDRRGLNCPRGYRASHRSEKGTAQGAGKDNLYDKEHLKNLPQSHLRDSSKNTSSGKSTVHMVINAHHLLLICHSYSDRPLYWMAFMGSELQRAGLALYQVTSDTLVHGMLTLSGGW